MFKYSLWVELPFDTRIKIATLLGLEKKGSTEVFANKVVRDGFVIKELEDAITKEKIQAFFDTKEDDSDVLWQSLVNKAEGKTSHLLEKGFGVENATDDSKPLEIGVINAKPAGRTKKNA